MEKYSTDIQATCDILIQGMSFVRWITKATTTHAEYVTFLLFYSKSIYANMPEYYVIIILPVFTVLLFWN
jgi:hypothetical protein